MREDKIIKGVVASKGVGRGNVRVITDIKEVMGFLEGEVLVAEYTNPSYVSAMIKSVAVITESGGITSHAAIISRELSIPCLVAVKGATKLLKTGDWVEVDANNGIVRILDKS